MLEIFLKTIPLMLVTLTGFLASKYNLFGQEFSRELSRFCFMIAMPAYLFVKFSEFEMENEIAEYVLCYLTVLIIGSIITVLLSRIFFCSSRKETALNVMGGVQVNTAYIAIPIFITYFDTAIPVLPIIFIQVTLFTMTIVYFIKNDTKKDISEVSLDFLNVLKTPIILSSILGLLCSIFQLSTPNIIEDSLILVGSTSAPLALFSLGMGLNMTSTDIRENLFEAGMLIIIKNIAFPTLAFIIGYYVFNLSNIWLMYLVLMAAMPSPQNMFIFAMAHNGNHKKASLVVSISSIMSFLLIPIYYYLATR